MFAHALRSTSVFSCPTAAVGLLVWNNRGKHRSFGKDALRSLLPNLLTLGNLSAGICAVSYSSAHEFKAAIACTTAAVFFDATDGLVARKLNVVSRLGAILDAFADLISFGISPALLVYAWSLSSWKFFGLLVALTYSCCAAVRLAIFLGAQFDARGTSPSSNSTTRSYCFTGLPTLAASGVVLAPVVYSFNIDGSLVRSTLLLTVLMLATSILMISSVKFPSPRIAGTSSQRRKVFALMMFGLIAFGIVWPWWSLIAALVVYIGASVVITLNSYAHVGLRKRRMDVSL
jgi:CDP-diacylglycerol---serine O-phosphatidyltransferase